MSEKNSSTAPKVTSFKSGTMVSTETKKGYGIVGTIIIIFMYFLYILFFPVTFYAWSHSVFEYQRAVILRLGRIRSKGAKGPGFFLKLPCVDTVKIVDLRLQNYVVPKQVVLTRDSVSIEVHAVCFFKVVDPVSAVVNVEDYIKSVHGLAAATVRNTLGMKTLDQILHGQESLDKHMQGVLDSVTEDWGVKVERIGLKDVILPPDMRRAMASIAEEKRAAKARVITAEAERNASVILRSAADKLTENAFSLQLRLLQTVTRVATEHESNIIFPIPMNMLDNVSGRKSVPPKPTS